MYDITSGVTVLPASMLKVGNEDGISVTFTYDGDERDLVQSALIRWNMAETSFFGESYSADRKFLQSMSLASITFVSNMDASH